jgi:hypothetical protein
MTAASPSPMVIGFFMARFMRNSQSIAVDMLSATTLRAGTPYWEIPKITAGSPAIMMS